MSDVMKLDREILSRIIILDPTPSEDGLLKCFCLVCKKCKINPKTGICLCGGPFDGYKKVYQSTAERMYDWYRSIGLKGLQTWESYINEYPIRNDDAK